MVNNVGMFLNIEPKTNKMYHIHTFRGFKCRTIKHSVGLRSCVGFKYGHLTCTFDQVLRLNFNFNFLLYFYVHKFIL